MDITCLEAFVAVAKHGSFSRAAESMNMTQPAVSRKIKLLESECGFPLFARTPHAVLLTNDGAKLLKEAKAAVSAYEGFYNRVASVKTEAPGSLNIAYFGMPYEDALIVGALDGLIAKYPRVEIGLLKKEVSEVTECLANGSADILIGLSCYLPFAKPYRNEALGKFKLQVLLPARHPLARRKRVRVSELGGETVLLPNQSESPLDTAQFVSYLREKGLAGIRVQHVGSYRNIAPLVALGQGISFHACGRFDQCEGTKIVGLEEEVTPSSLYSLSVFWLESNENHLIGEFVESAKNFVASSRFFQE